MVQYFVRNHSFILNLNNVTNSFLLTALGLAFGTLLLGRCLIEEGGLKRFEITNGSIAKNCTIFMIFGLTGLLLGMIFTNFIARKSLGIFLLTVYLMGFLSVVFSEFNVIHPYGTDHLC